MTASVSAAVAPKKIDLTAIDAPDLPPSFGQAVQAGLVDKAFATVAGAKRWPRIATFPSQIDSYFGHAQTTALNGVGTATAATLAALGVKTVREFTNTSVDFAKHFGASTAGKLTELQAALQAIKVRFGRAAAPRASFVKVVGTAGLSVEATAQYKSVCTTQADKYEGNGMLMHQTLASTLANSAMAGALRELAHGAPKLPAPPAGVDVAQYKAVIAAAAKAVRSMMMRAFLAEGAGRAWNDIATTLEALAK